MNEIYGLIFIIIIILFITIINEAAIIIFRLKNPKTRFWIYMVSFSACFSIFLFIPLKYMDMVIVFDKASLEDKIYTIKPDSIAFMARYTDFATLSLILGACSLLFLISFISLSRRIVEKKKKMVACKSPKVDKIVSSLGNEFGITVSCVSLFRGDGNAFVYGFPPALAISERLVKKLNADELRIVLKHEFCHMKNRDTLLKPFLISLCLFFVYNPAIYFIYRKIMEQREYIADRKAISTPQDKKTFLSLLLKIHGSGFPAGCGFASKTNRRVDTLLSEERHRWLPLFLSLMLTTSILGTCDLYLKTQDSSIISIPSINYYVPTMRDHEFIFEEKMKKKERFEFFISEDASILESLKSLETKTKRNIVIRDWEYENLYKASVLWFVLDFDEEGNLLLHLSNVGKIIPKDEVFDKKMERREKFEDLASGSPTPSLPTSGKNEYGIPIKKRGHGFPYASTFHFMLAFEEVASLPNHYVREGY